MKKQGETAQILKAKKSTVYLKNQVNLKYIMKYTTPTQEF